MNRELTHLFNKYQVKLIQGESSTPTLKGLSIQLQGGESDQLVFYRITDAGKAWERFGERLTQSKALCVVINRVPQAPINFQGQLWLCDDKHWTEFQKELCDYFYPQNSELILIGVTGTNGKTTTVNLIRDLLECAGEKACSVGTIGLQTSGGEVLEDLSITTPSYLDIRRILWQYQSQFKYFIFEVSSHALDQARFFGLRFKSAGWTNLTQDHLDYHHTLEAYAHAKAQIAQLSDHLFILANHPEVKAALDKIHAKYEVIKVECDQKDIPPFFKLAHNWENFVLALKLAETACGKSIHYEWSELHPPRGRFETLEWRDRLVVIDYAHTPDALAKILSSTKASFPDRRLICIFGAGGDRDPTKRPLMGQCAGEYADQVVITSDNPRSEDPALIIGQIEKGITNKAKILLQEADRRAAIVSTLSKSSAGDIIVIAGKGHETYQEVKGVKHPFDDKKVVQD